MRRRSFERESPSARVRPHAAGRRRGAHAARAAGAACLALAAGCAPGRAYPGAGGTGGAGGPGGPPPGLAAEVQDSTTLWLLALDPASVGIEAWTRGAWAAYEIGVRRAGARIRRISYKVLDREERGTWIEVRDEWVVVPAGDGERREPARGGPPLPSAHVEHWLLPFGPVRRERMLEQLTLDPDSGVRRSTYVRRPAAQDRTAFPATWLWVGADTLATPGGSVPTSHYRKSATNVWVAATIQPVGLVRAAGRGPLVSLVEWGSEGAVSSLPEVADTLEPERPRSAP